MSAFHLIAAWLVMQISSEPLRNTLMPLTP
jgi:hypothetical protein